MVSKGKHIMVKGPMTTRIEIQEQPKEVSICEGCPLWENCGRRQPWHGNTCKTRGELT